MTENGEGFEVFDTTTESILIKNDHIEYILEYDQDKLFATGYPTCMYLIDDWTNIRCI